MSNTPLTPNFTPGIGNLTTNRYDFEAHIQGTNFRQQASTVDVIPAITIDGYPTINNLQQAISVLSEIANPIIPAATSNNLGVIKLSTLGDVQGSANLLRVVNIQGVPISTSTPINGDVLTFNGTSWIPQLPTNSFTAAGDLVGSAVSQTIIGLTGSSGSVKIHCNQLVFDSVTTPIITIATDAVFPGGNSLSIIGQSNSVGNGGNVVVQGGTASNGNINGSVVLGHSDGSQGIQLAQPTGTNRVISLCSVGAVSGINASVNTGDMVIFIANAVTNPNAFGIPSGGCLLYSSASDLKLHVKDGTGNDFALGSVSNPSTWGSLVSLTPTYLPGGEVYSIRTAIASPISSPQVMFTVALPNQTATFVDVTFVGNLSQANTGSLPSGGTSAQYSFKWGFERFNGSSPTSVGTLTTVDSRTVAGTSWTTPTITIAGNNLVITSGANSNYIINWVAVITLTFAQ